MVTDLSSLDDAYAVCERLARRHYENFPVASRLLPSAMRPHVAAVYAFARTADDFADEEERPPGERQQLLDAWLDRLRIAVEEGSAGVGAGTEGAADERAIIAATAHTVHRCQVPLRLFADLMSAFRQDTVVTHYETFEALLDYCRRSANPVGRLVLAIAGYREERLERASDAFCTALQLTNFWQDLEQDRDRGRLYVPLDMVEARGAHREELAAGRLSPAWRAVLSDLAERTRELFLQGRDVADLVRGRLRLELRLTWLGGWRILERLERQGFDVFGGRRPTLGIGDVPLLLWRAATWRNTAEAAPGQSRGDFAGRDR